LSECRNELNGELFRLTELSHSSRILLQSNDLCFFNTYFTVFS